MHRCGFFESGSEGATFWRMSSCTQKPSLQTNMEAPIAWNLTGRPFSFTDRVPVRFQLVGGSFHVEGPIGGVFHVSLTTPPPKLGLRDPWGKPVELHGSLVCLGFFEGLLLWLGFKVKPTANQPSFFGPLKKTRSLGFVCR